MIILPLLLLLVILSSCQPLFGQMLLNEYPRDEKIFCSAHPNSVVLDESRNNPDTVKNVNSFDYRIKIFTNQERLDSNRLSVEIEATERSFGKDCIDGKCDSKIDYNASKNYDHKRTVLAGKKLKVGDTFTFQGVTWKILHIGVDGIRTKEYEVCKTGFVHIKQIQP